jgi:hypothetical protein
MFGSRVRSKLLVVVVAAIAAATLVVGTPLAAFGASNASKPSPIPVVVSFTSSKATFTNVGGKLTLKAKLKYGETCKVTVSPKLSGFPKNFACTTSFSKSVTLATNKADNPISYTFGVVVKNKAGSGIGTNVVVTEGQAPPPISFTPSTLTFAPEGVFVADAPQIVTVHNNSSTTQLITGVTIGTTGDPSDFILNKNNCSYITAHANCSLAVQFQPSGAGLRTGTVNVLDSTWGTAGATAYLDLRGAGVWATATVENANISSNVLTFPGTGQGVLTASAYQYVTVVNVGTVPLYVSGISVTGGESSDFSITAGNCINQLTNSYPLIVGVGESCTFGALFEPSSASIRTTNVVVDDNTLGTQTQLQLQGTGVWGSATLQINPNPAQPGPVQYAFSPVPVGTQVDETVTIANTSAATLLFRGVTVSGTDPAAFNVTAGTCGGAGAQLIAGQTCTVAITFDPNETGGLAATLSIGDNSVDGGEVIDVTGTGTP